MSGKGTVLVTGGTGYIGSFTVLRLVQTGHDVIIVDNLYNSSVVALDRIELLTGVRPKFYKVDVTDAPALNEVFEKHPEIDSVIHFAALKAVGESVEKPLEYFRVNVGGSVNLLQAMVKHNVHKIVFSSSATVYGDATRFDGMIPIPEHCPLDPTNPYGHTKVSIEYAIQDMITAQRSAAEKRGDKDEAEKWNAAILRYFNPAGAHPTGIMGEDPEGIPFNLLPLLAQVATGQREKLFVFGDDYDSEDGTAIRDYIHILDLAEAHVAALDYLDKHHPGTRPWNLGTGKGSSVFHMIKAFESSVGHPLKYEVVGRRAGDVLNLTANPSRANKELHWSADRTIEQACDDLWKWTKNNPRGYKQDAPQELLEALKKQ
ncbi:UDP-glucose-4-epimerase [Ascosphaera aggregata]|nr:UDP-glucose-4-epimerase [Ascosphaera aggregata]